jgi:predicted NAD-dependent protein-ADP-ribosyltransferase YbiA (DUF1768 family)
MKDVLLSKFLDRELMLKLIDTGSIELIEDNSWGDTYWGAVNYCEGENHLGILLLEIRDFYRREYAFN